MTHQDLKKVWDLPRALPPNSMLEQTEATDRRLYFPMGEALLFETNAPTLLEAADEALGRFAKPPDDTQAPLVLRLFVHPEEPHPDWRSKRPPQPVYRTQGHLFYVTAGAHSAAVADLMQGYAFGFVTPQIALDHAVVSHAFIESMAFAMLSTARGFIGVHAACVVKGGTSLILQGKAGMGKSTTAYACARRGYQVLAEDGLLIRSDAGLTRLWGTPWKLHLLPESRHFFPELKNEQPKLQINGEWKLEVDLETYLPGSTVTDAAPGLVVCLERRTTSNAAGFEPVPLLSALRDFQLVWPWSVGQRHDIGEQVCSLLEHKTYRLHVNGSPDEVVDALDVLLDRCGRS